MERSIPKKATRYFLTATAVFILYNGVSRLWIGANEWGIHQFAFEFPLYLVFMGLLFFPGIESAPIRCGLPPLAFLIPYVLFDVVHARHPNPIFS